MVRPSSVTALDEESPSGDAKLSLWPVPLSGHFLVEIVHLLNVLHLNQHINDGLGADAGDSSTTDVMDGYYFLA